MTYNTTASLDNPTYTNYIHSGNCEDRFGHFYWSKNDSNTLDKKLKVHREDELKSFCLLQNLTKKEAGFQQLFQFSNHMVIAAEIFGREQSFVSIQMPKLVKVLSKQLKLAHWLMHCPDKKICLTVVPYKQKSSYVQIQLFAIKEGE